MKAVVVCHDCLKRLDGMYEVRTTDYRAGQCEECGKKSMVVTARIIKKEKEHGRTEAVHVLSKLS